MNSQVTVIHRMVAAANDGDLPGLICRMPSGWALMGEIQVLTGYCLLLPDPVVAQLNDLEDDDRAQYMADMAQLGDALLEVTNAVRINYAVFGNLEPALHAHVFPRFEDEPDDKRTGSPWSYDWNQAPAFDEAVHGPLRDMLRDHLTRSVGEE